jgi:hypothetical protein
MEILTLVLGSVILVMVAGFAFSFIKAIITELKRL